MWLQQTPERISVSRSQRAGLLVGTLGALESGEGLEAYRDRPETLPRREVSEPDVKAIREQFGLSQSQMAAFLNVSKRTLENWEQGRRGPTGPAQALLRIMEREPRAVRRALRT